MKKMALVFLLVITFLSVPAQSKMILDVFRLLPADKIYGLSLGTRDSMLNGKTYYPADNDSTSIEAFNYGISAHEKDYMYVSLSYETEQRATGMIEIRGFKTKSGEYLVLLSQTGGVLQVNYQQNDLSAFIYRNRRLFPYKKKLFPALDESIFMKQGTPDSVKRLVRNNSNMTYNFSKKTVTLGLNSSYLFANPETEKWLKGDQVEFSWTGDRFIINKVHCYECPNKLNKN